VSILKYVGIETVPYRYFDTETRGVDFEGMLEDLGKGDCCINSSRQREA